MTGGAWFTSQGTHPVGLPNGNAGVLKALSVVVAWSIFRPGGSADHPETRHEKKESRIHVSGNGSRVRTR
jgi:hypothetical protein